MHKKAMRKNLLVSIKKSMGRYIAILAIIALGSGLFVGLLATKADIVATGQVFADEQNMFDLRLLNNYGWTQDEVDSLNLIDEVHDAEGLITLDVIGYMGRQETDAVFQLHTIPAQVSKVLLLAGRMPENSNECLADGFYADENTIGTVFHVSDANEQDTLDSLKHREFNVVGYVSTPLFMDMTRGNTTLGNGTITSYVYLPEEAFDTDYYTEIALTFPISHRAYTDVYDDSVEQLRDQLEPKFEALADRRYQAIYDEAMDEYLDGLQEYEDGLLDFEEGKREAQQKLDDALVKLQDGEKEISDGEAELQDAQQQINSGWAEVRDSKNALEQAQTDLDKAKADAYAQLDDAEQELNEQKSQAEAGLTAVNDGLAKIEAQLPSLIDGITQLEEGIAQLKSNSKMLADAIQQAVQQAAEIQQQIDALIAAGNYDQSTMQTLQGALAQVNAAIEEYTAQKNALDAQLPALEEQLLQLQTLYSQITEQKAQLEAQKQQILDGLALIDAGFKELEDKRTEADRQFAAAQEEIDNGFSKIAEAEGKLRSSQADVNKAKEQLEEAKQELSDGWKEYYDGKADADSEIAEAEAELTDAKTKLDDAKSEIEDLEEATLYMLDRNTNMGYLAVNNNADIVAGVSRVFPVFFLLVASLVCITTMTRMVEEERTQIGTLKALGYSNASIISKYLIYAGSAAVVGCGVGVLVGSVVFPLIIWQGYSIILELKPELEILFDIPLCVAVVLVYTVVILLVTWYCCRMSLRQTPAELIRPKAPTAGKKILLEYIPLWDKISFLNKVTFRNIFRYKQRLLMMLVGIGGCTALLVTGFGMGDSIMDVVSYQYEEVTKYDIQVQFKEGQTAEQLEKLRDDFTDKVDDFVFVHQSSVDVEYNNTAKSLYLINSDDSLEKVFDLHSGEKPLSMPGAGEVLLSVGTAKNMGIHTGDTIILRNADMQPLSVKVSGIFDNNVYNYVILTEATPMTSWSAPLEVQTAFVRVNDDADAHAVSAELAALDSVLSVMVTQDMADQIGSMLDGLDLIIGTIVVCAGLLAVIVLYNLTNINIKERIREISTIKVLGFRAGETAAYVFKENLLLTAMGAAIGLGLGKLLLDFVMEQIKIDIVWMQSRITGQSLILSVVITMLMALLVDFVLYFRLDRINMAESLKSVE